MKIYFNASEKILSAVRFVSAMYETEIEKSEEEKLIVINGDSCELKEGVSLERLYDEYIEACNYFKYLIDLNKRKAFRGAYDKIEWVNREFPCLYVNMSMSSSMVAFCSRAYSVSNINVVG